MHRPSPAEAEAATAGELASVRPDLVPRYERALPGARAAVLTRLWRALAHEPLPWVEGRESGRDGLTVRLSGGRTLHGPHPDPYATTDHVCEVLLDGVPFARAAPLVAALRVPHGDGFAAELAHSTASLALSRAAAPGPGGEPVTSWEWEQRIVDGHPFHPGCRSRPGFSVAEQLAYGPEHRPVVELGLAAAEDCLVSGEWPERFREGRRILVPVHPWQAEHVLKSPVRDGFAAHPLMSLRTLALPGGGPHVKTALSARLTSSVRDISVYSIGTSAAVSAFAQAVAARTDGLLRVTRTLGAVSAGSPDLAALLRESPEECAAAGAGEQVVPVAALALTGLSKSPSWLADFARLALVVGLRMLELGVAMEAHGQNLLVVLAADGTPVRLVYRDLADMRVSPARLARHGLPAPGFAGRIVTDDVAALRRKLFGSLVAGTLAAAAGSGAVLGEALAAATDGLPDSGDLRALCTEPVPAKALTLMRLSPDRPGDIWASLPNPLDGPGGS